MDKRQPLLIVEDDPALLTQIKWSLSQYDCVLASDQEQALAQLRRHEPAVVTMDLGLPPCPDDPSVGLALLGEMLALAPDTKVIVLTGQDDRANALKAVALGAYDFLAKPFEPEVLALTLERAYRLTNCSRRTIAWRNSRPGLRWPTSSPATPRCCAWRA